MPSDEAAIAALREARLPCGPVLMVEKAMQHPHLVKRQTVQTVHDRILGDFSDSRLSFAFLVLSGAARSRSAVPG